jgi:hypothetical protein
MSFAEQFAKSRGRPIDCEGRLVHAIYRRQAKTGLSFRLRWISGIENPRQGVSISAKGGVLRVKNTEAKDIVLWRDTAPDEVLVTCVGRGLQELLVWNCWRDDRGAIQAWINNSGMLLDDTGGETITIRCNSRSLVTFEDLVFELVF